MIIALSACHSCTPASNPALLLRACYLTITCVHTRSQINDTPALLTPTTYFTTRYDKHAWLVGLLAYLARCSALQWAHQQLARGATLRIDRYPARQPVLRLWEPAEPSEVRLPIDRIRPRFHTFHERSHERLLAGLLSDFDAERAQLRAIQPCKRAHPACADLLVVWLDVSQGLEQVSQRSLKGKPLFSLRFPARLLLG